MIRTTVAALAASMLIAAPAHGDEGHVDAAVAQLPGLVEQMMASTGVPGVAVAVVHHDKVVYSQGFGVRDTQGSDPVTPDTVFQVASVSKPVGASAVAAAIGKKALSWDDPVTEHLPAFAMKDKWVTKHVTVGDLYAHRSGLPGDTGNDLESFGLQQSTIFKRMRYSPLAPLRITYAYSNFGMTVAGVAAAAAYDTTWPKLTRKLLFKPLGMSNSSYRYSDFGKQANRATLHQQVGATWVPGPKRDADAQAPAGGLSSNVVDMAKWLRMELANGKFDGERVVAAEPLQTARSLQIRKSAPADDASRMWGYAFGMDTEMDDTGHINWSHSGAFTAGAATRILMLPAYDTGIVVLTNGWPVGLPEALGQSFVDLVETGAVTRDWLPVIQPAFAPYTTPNRTVFGKPKPAAPKPAAALGKYAGTYRSDYLGEVRVTRAGKRLTLRVGKVSLPLRHWTGNTFAYRAIDMPKGFTVGVRFRMAGGVVTAVNLEEVSAGEGKQGIPARVG